MENNWYNFQEEIKNHFVSLGCKAETNIRITGVRTFHDIDVLVETKFLGHNMKWIIEAKKWDTKVSKLHVLALRQIVDDIGADKGFIISEKGFQKGAFEASNNTNISLLTFNELKSLADSTIQNEILNNYLDRVNLIVCRYFAHSKSIRKKYELRGDTGSIGDFSVYILLIRVVQTIKFGKENDYPIDGNSFLNEQFGEKLIEDFDQLINWLNLNLLVIDERIIKAEILMQKNGEFNPNLDFAMTNDNFHMTLLSRL